MPTTMWGLRSTSRTTARRPAARRLRPQWTRTAHRSTRASPVDPATSEKLVITVNDDSPVINSADSANDISFLNSAKAGSGTFDYSIGLDNRSAFTSSSSDLLLSFIGGTVGSTAISNTSIGWTSESATQAVFTFGFDYNSNPNDLTAI